MADAEVSAQLDADLQTTETSSPPSSPASSSSSFFSTASPLLLPASAPSLPPPLLPPSPPPSSPLPSSSSSSSSSSFSSTHKQSKEKSPSPREKSPSPSRQKSPSPSRDKSPSPSPEKPPSPLPVSTPRSSVKKASGGEKKKPPVVEEKPQEEDDPTIDESHASDDICGVCWEEDAEETEENDIVFCDGCDIAVHQKCYGVGKIPEGEWYCDKCVYVKKNPTKPRPYCCLCSVLEGPLKKFHEKDKWAHSSCVLFGWEGFHYFDEVKKLGIKSNNKIWAERAKWLKCKICGEGKFNIQCAEKKCHIAFHPTCAKKKGYKSVYQSVDLDWIDDEENNWDVVRYFLCQKHRDMSVKTYVENHKHTLGKAGNKDDDDEEEDNSSILSSSASSSSQKKRPSSSAKKTKPTHTTTPKRTPSSSSKTPSSSKTSSSSSSKPSSSSSSSTSSVKKKLNDDEIFEELEETEAIESEKTEQEKTRKKDKGSKKEKKKEKRAREKEKEREREKKHKSKDKDMKKKEKAKISAIKTPSSPLSSSPRASSPLPSSSSSSSSSPSSCASSSVSVGGKLPTRAALPIGAINKVKLPVDEDQLGPRMKKELLKKHTQMLPISLGDEALKREKKRKREEEERAEHERNLRIKQEKEALLQLTQSLSKAQAKPMEKFVPKDRPKSSSSSTSKYSEPSRSRSPKGRDDGYKRLDRDRASDRGSDRDRGRDDRRYNNNYPPSSRLGGSGHKDRDLRPAERMSSWSRPPSQQVVHVPVYVPVPTFRPPPPPPRGPPPPPPRGLPAPYASGSQDYHHPNFEVSWRGVDPRRPTAAATAPLSSSRGPPSNGSAWNAAPTSSSSSSSASWDNQWGAPTTVENAFQAMEDQNGGDVALDLLDMLSSLDRQPKA